MEVISSYSREDAIADGVLVDVSETAKEAGIIYPVALTHAVFTKYVEVPPELEGLQDLQGRLWDLLTMFRHRARHADSGNITFQVLFQMPDKGDWTPTNEQPHEGNRKMRLVTLKALCGPGDRSEPVITIMRPDED